jgi:FkbM family methyltransferase
MLRAALRAVGRQLRRAVQPLVGYWDLRSLLEQANAQRILQVASIDRIGNTIDQLRTEHASRDQALYNMIDQLRTEYAARDQALVSALDSWVGEGIERLDGYLVHHAAALGLEIENHSAALRLAIDGVRIADADYATACLSALNSVTTSLATLQSHLGPLQSQLAATNAHNEAMRIQLGEFMPQTSPLYLANGLNVMLHARGYDLVVPSDEDGLLSYLVRHGIEAVEPGVRYIMERRIRPGAIVIEGGPNVGLHSVTMAAAVGSDGSITCFEPLARIANALERTLRLNGFAGRVKVERLALSDTTGTATFNAALHSPYSSLFGLSENIPFERCTVSKTSLDDYIPEGTCVHFVKLDIEGAEPCAWRGMRRVLRESPGIEIIMEWSASHFARSGEDPSAFMRDIRSAGFMPYVIEDGPTIGQLSPVSHESAMTLEGSNLLLTQRLS